MDLALLEQKFKLLQNFETRIKSNKILVGYDKKPIIIKIVDSCKKLKTLVGSLIYLNEIRVLDKIWLALLYKILEHAADQTIIPEIWKKILEPDINIDDCNICQSNEELRNELFENLGLSELRDRFDCLVRRYDGRGYFENYTYREGCLMAELLMWL